MARYGRIKGGRGDEGADTFVFGAGRDVIRDFAPGEDVLDLTAAKLGGWDALEDAARERDSTLVLDLDEGRLVLKGIELLDLGADDFLL